MKESPTSTLDEFASQLVADDELGSVIRAHLHIEYHLDQLTKAVAPNPAALPALALDYSGRVRLLSVLGYEEGLTKPLQNLGSLRNKFSHELGFRLTKDRMRNLYQALDAFGKQAVHHAYANTRKKSNEKHPKDMWSLEPKMIFSLLASTIRVQLLLAYKQQTGKYPKGSVPARFILPEDGKIAKREGPLLSTRPS